MTEEASGARGGLFGAGGRFKGGTDPVMEKFNESLSFDKRCVASASGLGSQLGYNEGAV